MRISGITGLAVLAIVLSACGGVDDTSASTDFAATLRRTSYGVPHITADDYGSLGFGQGYALAQDHFCTLADQIVKVRSERAFFFGRGPDDRHVNSDFAYLHLGIYRRAVAEMAQQPPDVLAFVSGFAAGVNHYVDEVGVAGLRGYCSGAGWVRPITAADLFAYAKDVAIFASARVVLNDIGGVQPPTLSTSADVGLPTAALLRRATTASNAWAIGAKLSASHRGILLANPHFPWVGELRFWESHLTIPGKVDVYGVSLIGFPGVQIGFNQHVAWSHTVSAGRRMTFYALDLVPGTPTRYRYGGGERDMVSTEYTINVRQDDGSIVPLRRTLYASHYGPIVNPAGLLPWTSRRAYTVRDANIDNAGLVAQWMAMDAAGSLAEFQQAHARFQAMPFINTIAADDEGHAWYVDSAATPNLSAAAIASWRAALESNPATQLFNDSGATLLDGKDPLYEWVDEPAARSTGLVPFAHMPQLERADYVFNSNDAYWLTNPAAPLVGYSPLHGLEQSPQSPRTRMNILLLEELKAKGRLRSDDLQESILSNRSLVADLLRDTLVTRCMGAGPLTVAGKTVELSHPCEVLARWDGRFDVDSVGAVLFREFVARYPFAAVVDSGPLFSLPFDPIDPVHTPSGLTPAPVGADPILQNLAFAVTVLNDQGVTVDQTLGEVQFAARGGGHIPVPGGQEREGVANINGPFLGSDVSSREPIDDVTEGVGAEAHIAPSEIASGGYRITFGGSFVMLVEFTDAGPVARGVLTYGESGDTTSAHFADQTLLFSQKQLRALPYREADIIADPQLSEVRLRGARP